MEEVSEKISLLLKIKIVTSVVTILGSAVMALSLTFWCERVGTFKMYTIPEQFLMGTGTAAYQVEGAWNSSNKEVSQWDMFTHALNIKDRSSGDVASDTYHKYEEDIELLKNLSVNFYRFSISWTRILPEGFPREINLDEEGVNYYLKLLKKLRESNIEPIVTLYYWDLPDVFNQIGGWTNPFMANFFGDYARICYSKFGQYVRYWITMSEPETICLNGYGIGDNPPNVPLLGIGNHLCAYVQLLAHAEAYHIYRNEFYKKQKGKVSISLFGIWLEPSDYSGATEERMNLIQNFKIGMYAHPIFKGNWPKSVQDTVNYKSRENGYYMSRLPNFTMEEINKIKGTADFFALNYYYSWLTTAGQEDEDNNEIDYLLVLLSGCDRNPTYLRKLINWIADEYDDPEIFITENGYPDKNTTQDDYDRITYLSGHLCSVMKAIHHDYRKVIGYTQFPFLDGFSWLEGYTEKWGIVSINFDDPELTRTPKESYTWLKNIIEGGTINCSVY